MEEKVADKKRAKIMSQVFEFPLQMPVEAALVERLKEVTYEFYGRVIVAQVIGCLQIASDEIKDAQ